ncbi:MAG TPA: hypothetical protein PKU97_14390, partial [Kofleriaceae bacterium]|nr:hypothetical protein [Kofleriaceae bacterium]
MRPQGASWRESLPLLLAGETAVREVTHFDTAGFPSRVAAWIGDDAVAAACDRRAALTTRALEEIEAEVELAALAGPTLGVFLGAESGRAVQLLFTEDHILSLNFQPMAYTGRGGGQF